MNRVSFFKILSIIIGSLIFFFCSPIMAESIWRGFATSGYTVLLNSEEGDNKQKISEFSGTNKKGSFIQLTRFGLNLTSLIDSTTHAIVQFNGNGANLVYGNTDGNNFKVRATIISLKKIIGNYEIIAGLFSAPFYMISEQYMVGYSHMWAQQPKAFYSTIDIQSMSGIKLISNNDFGDLYLKTTLSMGEAIVDFTISQLDAKVSSNDYPIVALVFNAEYEETKIRLGLTKTVEASLNFDTPYVLTDTSNGTVFQGEQKNGCKDVNMDFINLGIENNTFDNVILLAEYGNRKSDRSNCFGSLGVFQEGYKTDIKSYYGGIGYTIGKFTPRITYVTRRDNPDLSKVGENFANSTLPPGTPDTVREDTSNGIIEQLKPQFEMEHNTINMGVNTLIHPNAMLKIEADFHSTGNGKNGMNLPVGGKATVLSVALDYVF